MEREQSPDPTREALEAENTRLRKSAETAIRRLNQMKDCDGWVYVLTDDGEFRIQPPVGFVGEPYAGLSGPSNAEAKGWRGDCFRSSMASFDEAYVNACASSQPDDWMHASLLAQQFRNVAYAVLTGEAPRQEPPADCGFVLVPTEPTDKMIQAGGQVLPPTHRLTDCYDYFREAWAAALSERPFPLPAAQGGR
jgi:hypothetical protein